MTVNHLEKTILHLLLASELIKYTLYMEDNQYIHNDIPKHMEENGHDNG